MIELKYCVKSLSSVLLYFLGLSVMINQAWTVRFFLSRDILTASASFNNVSARKDKSKTRIQKWYHDSRSSFYEVLPFHVKNHISRNNPTKFIICKKLFKLSNWSSYKCR